VIWHNSTGNAKQRHPLGNPFFSSCDQGPSGVFKVSGTKMTNVVRLVPRDRLRQDAGPIAAIYRNLGVQSADQVVGRALTELQQAMATVAQLLRDGLWDDLPRQLRRVERMATHLGMVTFATIAADLRACLEADDPTALHAVWARLERAAERSLAADDGGWVQSGD
jgi:hypothetical protein